MLHLSSNSSYDDTTQASAAGFIEGALSFQSIWDNWRNQFTNGSSAPYNFSPKLKVKEKKGKKGTK
jgi:hypothetical protein